MRELGGLHRFMAWDGPILTDSGGFQVFSLAKLRKIGEEGVEFRSHVDGSLRLLSPEICVEIQHALGVDILHPLDECLAYPATVEATERSLALTLRWLRPLASRRTAQRARGRALRHRPGRGLRRRCGGARWRRPCALDLPGYAIGGLAVGEPKPLMYDITELVRRAPARATGRATSWAWASPRISSSAVARGVDIFDCVLPTRNARNGQAFTAGRAAHHHATRASRATPRRSTPSAAARPAGASPGPTCATCSWRASSCYRLLSLHNLTFYLGLMADDARGHRARRASRHSALGFSSDMG